MAKIEPWEERIRDEMAEFANQLNNAPQLAMLTHDSARAQDPDHVPEIDWEAPGVIEKLVQPARQLLLVSQSAKLVIQSVEDDDLALRHKGMKYIVEFSDGMVVRMSWVFSDGQYHMDKVLESPEETHPLVVASLVFGLDNYLNRYRDIVHLGVCRVCRTAYLKPKHGQKMRYCSPACRQKAYRKRHEEGAAKQT
jgi:hypothetical protein